MPKKSFYKQTAKVDTDSTTTVFEVEKPVKFTKSGENRSILPYNGKWGAWFLTAGLMVLILTLVSAAGVGWWYWHTFETTANVNLFSLVKNIWRERQTDLYGERRVKTFLVLGLDQSKNQRENELLTDTIIFGSINREGNIRLVSIPRDYWVDSLKTKVNALYYYGQQTNPNDGFTLVSSVVAEMSGMPVDYFVIINMDSLRDFIDAVGGIDVTVARSFEDNQYPREIDLKSKDPVVLYETVRFEAGLQHMDGPTALKYIRSRHSTDPIEGTNEGREQRQQVLLSALQKKLTLAETLTNPRIMGTLFRVWKTSVKTNLSDSHLFLLAKSVKPSAVTVTSALIPIAEASQSGLIYHPQEGPAKQWVYLPVDATLQQFHEWFMKQLE